MRVQRLQKIIRRWGVALEPKLVRKNLNIQPTLEIRPGFAMNILVHKDVVMRPYDASQDQGVLPSLHRRR